MTEIIFHIILAILCALCLFFDVRSTDRALNQHMKKQKYGSKHHKSRQRD